MHDDIYFLFLFNIFEGGDGGGGGGKIYIQVGGRGGPSGELSNSENEEEDAHKSEKKGGDIEDMGVHTCGSEINKGWKESHENTEH